MSMIHDKCGPVEAEQLQRLLRQVLQSACERRADLLVQRRKIISQLAEQLGCNAPIPEGSYNVAVVSQRGGTA